MDEFIKYIIQNLGVPGLITFFGYRLVDKFMTRHLDVAKQQADAIAAVAKSMQEQRDDQRDVLIAVRVMSNKMDEMIGRQREINHPEALVKAVSA